MSFIGYNSNLHEKFYFELRKYSTNLRVLQHGYLCIIGALQKTAYLNNT